MPSFSRGHPRAAGLSLLIVSLFLLADLTPAQGRPRRGRRTPAESRSSASESPDEGKERNLAPSADPDSSSMAAPALPAWDDNIVWTVKSIYRKQPKGKSEKGASPEDPDLAGWSDPLYWSFTVKIKKGPSGANYYLVQVRNRDGSKANMASLFFAKFRPQPDGPEVLSLFKGKYYSMVGDQPRQVAKTYAKPPSLPQPVFADDSLIPYDLPALPFLAPAPPGQAKTALTRTYSIVDQSDGLKFARDVIQLEHQRMTIEAFCGKEVVEYLKTKGWPTSGVTLVELRRQFDGCRVKQVWNVKVPWFLYSESPTCRSWLWEIETSAKPVTEPVHNPSAAAPSASSPTPSPIQSAAHGPQQPAPSASSEPQGPPSSPTPPTSSGKP